MWNLQLLRRLDYRLIFLLSLLMIISLLVISSTTAEDWEGAFTPYVKKQLQFFTVGWIVFFLMSSINYQNLRDLTWILYGGMILLLIGLFFAPAIQNVHRWYRIGGFSFQPSEYAKLIVVIALSSFFEKKSKQTRKISTTVQACMIVFIPFALIVKQPDLGTALVLFPISLILFYFGGVPRRVIATMSAFAFAGFAFVTLMFLGVINHDKFRPVATRFLKEYQYERLNPNTYHQMAAQTAIALGGVKGSGFQKGEYTKGQWLPAASTDSVFPAFVEEFGLIGAVILLCIFFGLIFVSFQVVAVSKDQFGRLLAAGIAIYLAMHIVMNLGMMCGFLPITGVPLLMVSYGGSSIIATMGALGVLQSIYSRRFTF